MNSDIAAFAAKVRTMNMPRPVRNALLAAVARPGAQTDAELKDAVAALAAAERRDTLLASTPLGQRVLSERPVAAFAADISPTIRKMLEATPLGRRVLSGWGIQ